MCSEDFSNINSAFWNSATVVLLWFITQSTFRFVDVIFCLSVRPLGLDRCHSNSCWSQVILWRRAVQFGTHEIDERHSAVWSTTGPHPKPRKLRILGWNYNPRIMAPPILLRSRDRHRWAERMLVTWPRCVLGPPAYEHSCIAK